MNASSVEGPINQRVFENAFARVLDVGERVKANAGSDEAYMLRREYGRVASALVRLAILMGEHTEAQRFLLRGGHPQPGEGVGQPR